MANVKLIYRNILETGTVTVTTENSSYPKYRLYDRCKGKLFKATAYASPFEIVIDQGAVISYEVDRLIIPEGHNLNGLVCSLRYSTDNFAADDHAANDWIQSDGLIIDKEILDVTGAELISSGNMETGDPPTGWFSIFTPETFEQSDVQKHSGTYSLHINDSVASNGGAAYQTPKTAGKKYKLSYWYYIVSGVLRPSFVRGNAGGNLWYTAHSTTGSWLYNEIIVEETITGSLGGPQFINNSDSAAAEFYIDDVSVKEMIQTPITKRYWKLQVTAPATIPELTEMFLSKDYTFERNVKLNLNEEVQRNIDRDQTRSGSPRWVKLGEKKESRVYDLIAESAQKTNLASWWSALDSVKPFYVIDHNGDLLFMEMLNELSFTPLSNIFWATKLDLLEVP